MATENCHTRCGQDVPHTCSSDWKSLITDGWQLVWRTCSDDLDTHHRWDLIPRSAGLKALSSISCCYWSHCVIITLVIMLLRCYQLYWWLWTGSVVSTLWSAAGWYAVVPPRGRLADGRRHQLCCQSVEWQTSRGGHTDHRSLLIPRWTDGCHLRSLGPVITVWFLWYKGVISEILKFKITHIFVRHSANWPP